MKKIFIFLGILTLSTGCTTTMPDRITRLAPIELSQKTILVQPFDFDPNIAQQVDRNFVKDFGKEIAIDIAGCFLTEGKNSKVLLPGEQESGDLTIRGVITMVDGGSMHLRIWLGFGYGASMASARGEVIDLRTSKSLMNFYITKKSNWTWSNSEAAVRENIHEIAQELVSSILQIPVRSIGPGQSIP